MLIDGVTSGNTVTCAANDVVIVRAVSTTQFKLSRVKYDGTAQVSAGGLTLGTPVATTSGTAVNYTAIPSGTKLIIMSFNGVSTDGTSQKLIRIGDSEGLETTGYTANSVSIAVTTVTQDAGDGSGFNIYSTNAADDINGSIIFALLDSSANIWVATGRLNNSGTKSWMVSGVKALSAELDRITITTANGTDAFDAGSLNISYM